MPDNRCRLPEDELHAIAEVPLEEQGEVQSELVAPTADWRSDPMPWLDGGSGDADCDGPSSGGQGRRSAPASLGSRYSRFARSSSAAPPLPISRVPGVVCSW